MAIKKIKVSGTSYDINDPRIAGVDNEPIENSENVITSGAVYTALESAGGGGTGTVTGAKVGASGELIEPTEGVIVLPEYPTVPTNVSDFTNDAGYTTNTGTVTGVQVGSGSTISPTDGVVTIPAYPTSLPASDVYNWAKASSKPSYSYSEISGTPSLGTAAAKNVPSTGNASTTEVVMGDDTRLSDARNAADVYLWAKAASKPSYSASEIGLGNVTNDAQVKRTEMGAASGVATLGTDGKVPSSQLPSYVDDVLEYDIMASFPSTGESGKIYVALDTNKTYRWSGTAYVEISPSIVIGTTSGTAYDGASGAALASKLSGIEAGAQAHKAPTETEVKTALGATGSGTTKYLREDGSWATPPDNNTWTAASTSAAGYVPAATKGKFLHSNASTGALEWIDDNNTTYTLAELMGSSTKGSATQPVYWDGTAWQNTTYSLAKSVPSNAVFTDTNTHYTAVPVAGGSSATSNATSATSDPYINIVENSAKSGGIQIKGSGATTVSAKDGVITINSTDTNTQAVSSVVGQTGAVTASQIGTALTTAGYKLTDTDTNTWRPIQCDSTDIGSNTLNLVPGTNVSFSRSGGTITISSTDTNTWRPLGTTADTACAGNDSRLSDARPASDVYNWAKASSKPTYTASEVGAATSGHTHTTSIATSTGTNQITLAYGGKYALTAGGTSYVFTMPASDNTNTWRTVQCNSTSIGDNTLNLVAGSNVTLTRDGGKITIASTDTNTNTTNSAGASNKTGTKMFIVGATSQTDGITSYSNSNCYIGTDNCLYSGGTKVLTTHQDISGKADKASITAGTAGTSSATSGSTVSVPYVTMNAQGIVTAYGTHTHTISGFLTSHQSVAHLEPRMAIQSQAASNFTAAIDKYYEISGTVGTMTITLPSITADSYSHSIMFHFTTGSSCALTISSADSKSISYYADYAIDPSTEYEIHAIFNGTKWIIAYATIG